MNIDSYNGLRPSIKKCLKDRLKIGGMLEDVFYIIENIDFDVFGKNERQNNMPEIGESICIRYSFYKHASGPEFGYEFLTLFIGRLDKTGVNYVRYFKNIDELEKSISGLTLVLDKDFANTRIQKLNDEIQSYIQDYEINSPEIV